MAEIEKELERLFDTLDERELDELVDDITIEPDKQPDLTGLFDGKGHGKMKKTASSKKIAVTAALVAALGITATAGAVAAYKNNSTKHDETVQAVLGDDIGSKDYYVGENIKTDNGHLKLTNEVVLFDGENGLLILTIEPLDQEGERIISMSRKIDVDNSTIKTKDGTMIGNCNEEIGRKRINGCLVEYIAFSTFADIGDDTVTAQAELDSDVLFENMMSGTENMSAIEFDIKKNTEPVTLKNEKGELIHLSDYAVYIENTQKDPETAYLLDCDDITTDMTITYTDGRTETVSYSQDIKESELSNSAVAYCTHKYGYATVKYLRKLTDTKNIASVSFNGKTYTAEQR